MVKSINTLYSSLLSFVVGFVVCIFVLTNWKNRPTDLEIALNGPSVTAVGEILEYDAKIQSKPGDVSDVIFQWEVLRDGKEVNYRSMNNNSILFGSGQKNGRFLILLNGVAVYKHWLFWTEIKPIKPIMKEIVVGDNPNPDPTPNPVPPAPNPVTPVDGKYKIAVLAYNTALAKVTSPKRAELFQAVAKNYLAVADQVAAGKLVTVQQVFTALKNLNSPLFSGPYSDVVSQYKEYDNVMQQFIYQLFTNKTLGPVSDYAALFQEVASGLACVR